MENQQQMTAQDRRGPDTYRTTARAVGVLFLAGMVVGIGGNSVVLSIVGEPDHLATVSAHGTRLAIGAMLMLLAGVWDAAHGILMFPVLKRHSERIAFGYLGYRLIDAAFIGGWVLFLLLQIPLGREYLNATASDVAALQALSAVLMQASQYAYQIAMIFVGLVGLLLCSIFYRTRLVPRFVAAWGLGGYALHLGGAVAALLGFDLSLLSALPGGLWEMFIGVWLIAKGFSPSPHPTERPAPTATYAPVSASVDSATV